MLLIMYASTDNERISSVSANSDGWAMSLV